MIVTCNEEHYEYMPSFRPVAGPCGKTYDDAECSTICPHEPLPPFKISYNAADLKATAARLGISLDLPPSLE